MSLDINAFFSLFRWWKFPDYNGTASPASRAIDEAAVRGLTVRDTHQSAPYISSDIGDRS